jgi:hypothetical protein
MEKGFISQKITEPEATTFIYQFFYALLPVFTRHDRAILYETREETVQMIFDCFGNVTVQTQ